MTDAVRVESLRKTYDGTVTALDGVTASFAAGSFTAVMGPSGSGKSTLLQCAAGLDRPDAGRVLIDGTELTTADDTVMTKFRRLRVGFVFQDYNLLPALTVEQNVVLPLRLAGKRADRRRVRAVLDRLGLGDRLHDSPERLSGGQRQRVAVARTLVTDPAVIFADEPTGALDMRSARDVLTLLRAVVHEHGRTVVMVTHDPVAAAYADSVLFLAGVATARRTSAPDSARPPRPRLRRLAALLFLLVGASCAVLTATVMDGKGIDAMQTAGQAGIWAAIGLALLSPSLLRLVTAVLARPVRAFGVAGELAVQTVYSRVGQLAAAVMPVVVFTGAATGTIYMQGIEDRAAIGQIEPDYAQDVQTLNYVVIGMITLFVAIMLVNTLMAATVRRRREFAQQRLAGATRGQLVAMVSLEGLLITVSGVLGGSVAALFTILPFGLARADRLWPDATPADYLAIVTVAVLLTAAATIGATRRTLRGPATAAVSAG